MAGRLAALQRWKKPGISTICRIAMDLLQLIRQILKIDDAAPASM
jgi:hypothetical protein